MNDSLALQLQRDTYLKGAAGQRPLIPQDFGELERQAAARLRPEAFAYIAGGAGLEETMSANRAAFGRHPIVPRMLRDVGQRDISTDLFGKQVAGPLLLSPVGVLDLAHPDGDMAVARAAAAEGIPMIFSNQASRPMEETAAAMGSCPSWFQLYWSKSRDLVASLVSRAEACGCSAIAITLDTTMLGWRPRDLREAYLPFLQGKGIAQYTSDPVFQKLMDDPEVAAMSSPPPRRITLRAISTLLAQARHYPAPFWQALRTGRSLKAVRTFTNIYSNPALTWEQLSFVREHTRLPILLKGVLHPDDARQALDRGIDGLIVSNHGGRQVDGSIGSLTALAGIAAAVGRDFPLLMDSGVRGGADMFKALALGARAVCIGRPFAYALALAGQAGVQALIRQYLADFELTMGLAGCRHIKEIGPDMLLDG